MGGGLAAEAAGANPALVRAVVLLDPVNYALASSNEPWDGVTAQAPRPQPPLSFAIRPAFPTSPCHGVTNLPD